MYVEHPIFVPLGRLSLSMYLSQLIVLASYYALTYEYIPISFNLMVSCDTIDNRDRLFNNRYFCVHRCSDLCP